jgi:hypothetical protein
MVNSDVFMAMFSHENTKEAREGRIQITNSTGAAVRQMLFFMYTGELPTEYAKLLSRWSLLTLFSFCDFLLRYLLLLINKFHI